MSYPTMSTSVPWSLIKNGFHKTPSFNNVVQKTGARRSNSGFTLTPYPTWAFEVDLEAVLGGEAVQGSLLQAFLGCYMATCASAQPFLFTDPNDNAVTTAQGVMLNTTPGAAAPMGKAGDGSSRVFQLARTIDQGTDVLQFVSITQVNVNGTPTTSYSVSTTGELTFDSAPPADAVLTWAGTFRYLCRFTDDTLQDLARVNKNGSGWLWSCGSIKFESEFA